MWMIATPTAKFYSRTQADAEEQAGLIRSEWKVPVFVQELYPCTVCGGEREDDKSEECDGCLMEMAEYYESEEERKYNLN